jgi:hypothetical protein
MATIEKLFNRPLQVVNIGVIIFYESVKAQKTPCIHVDWKPPAGGNEKLLDILSRLQAKDQGEKDESGY